MPLWMITPCRGCDSHGQCYDKMFRISLEKNARCFSHLIPDSVKYRVYNIVFGTSIWCDGRVATLTLSPRWSYHNWTHWILMPKIMQKNGVFLKMYNLDSNYLIVMFYITEWCSQAIPNFWNEFLASFSIATVIPYQFQNNFFYRKLLIWWKMSFEVWQGSDKTELGWVKTESGPESGQVVTQHCFHVTQNTIHWHHRAGC